MSETKINGCHKSWRFAVNYPLPLDVSHARQIGPVRALECDRRVVEFAVVLVYRSSCPQRIFIAGGIRNSNGLPCVFSALREWHHCLPEIGTLKFMVAA